MDSKWRTLWLPEILPLVTAGSSNIHVQSSIIFNHLQSSNNHPTIIQQSSNNHPTIIQQSSNNHPTIIQQSSNKGVEIIQQNPTKV